MFKIAISGKAFPVVAARKVDNETAEIDVLITTPDGETFTNQYNVPLYSVPADLFTEVRKIGTLQDGADFYVVEGGKVVTTFHCDFKVPDMDLDAADRARAWFLAVALPIFLGTADVPSNVVVDWEPVIDDDDEPSWVDSPNAPGNC